MVAAGGGAEFPRIDATYRAVWQAELAEAELHRGRAEEAEAWADRAEEAAAVVGMVGRTGWAARARAAALLARGDAAAAAEAAFASSDALDRACAPLDAARSATLAGAALAAAGQTDDAIGTLEAARDRLDARGAITLRDKADRELRRLRRHAPRRPPSRGASLSGREREIAELVAAGKSNREIAADLYLSARTVESHVSRLLAKLGVRSRAAVGARIRES
jgi:DNA-binding NarL/FixJ family response regulator